jgi:hypothetical protein
MAFKHFEGSPRESPTSLDAEDKELQGMQAQVNRFLARGKKIVEAESDPPPFYCRSENGKRIATEGPRQ